jgi:hypothetical protein
METFKRYLMFQSMMFVFGIALALQKRMQRRDEHDG